MKLGLALDDSDPARRLALARRADERGLESVWLRERPGEDALAALAELVDATRRVRLAVCAHDLTARHPLVSAGRVAELDRASGGRIELGVRVDDGSAAAEALTLCKRLWCDPWVEHRGRHFALTGVAPAERPSQRPWSPVHVEGERDVDLELAARSADGWITCESRPEALAPRLARLRELRARAETLDGRFAVSVRAPAPSASALEALEALGVARVLVGAEWLE